MADSLTLELHDGLDRRPRPEDVATIIARLLHDRLTVDERRVLTRASRAAERPGWYSSFMPDDWERPVPATRTIAYVTAVFDGIIDGVGDVDDNDPDSIDAFVSRLGDRIGWQPGTSARWTKTELAASGLGISARRYKRAHHALTVLHDKSTRLRAMQTRRSLAQMGRVGLAETITAAEMDADHDAASFVAYLAAKKNLRRTFTLDGKDNAFDEIADMLYRRLTDTSDWWMVARANPTADNIARLDPTQQGQMIAAWWATMRRAAAVCAAIDRVAPVHRDTMIVQRGQDSDSWNLAAGAYNTARAGWVNALSATGSLDLVTVTCPPKLPRLMAGDLIYWHTCTGGDLTHPDVRVAALLPPAWEVLNGDATCDARDIREACQLIDIDPERTGWLAPLRHTGVGTFSPTPELVHGIEIGDPILASMLRRAHAFSGRAIRPEHLPDGDVPFGRG